MTTPVYSKPIRTTDESSKQLVQELLSSTRVSLSDIDSFYRVNGTYHFIEFIHCSNARSFCCLNNNNVESIPIAIHPLIEFVRQAKGILHLTLYNDDKDMFTLLHTTLTEDNCLKIKTISTMSFSQYKEWFKDINKKALGI